MTTNNTSESKLSEPPIGFRDRMRIARERSGIPQGKMAKILGLNPNTIGNWISGRTKTPPQDQLVKFCALCLVPITFLYKGDPDAEDLSYLNSNVDHWVEIFEERGIPSDLQKRQFG